MKLYHISRDLKFNGNFIPRIPFLEDESTENRTTPRICVSKTIEGCLSAIPGSYMLDEVCLEQRGMFRVYVFDTEKHQIQPEYLVLTDELDRKNEVLDAYLTEEVWITCPVTLDQEDSYIIVIKNYSEEICDCVPYDVRLLVDNEEYDGDLKKAYFDTFPNKTFLPSIDVVCDIDCVTSQDTFPLQETFCLCNEHFFDELVKEEAEMIKLWIETNPEWGMTCLGVENDEITLYFEHAKGFESFCKRRFRYVMEN